MHQVIEQTREEKVKMYMKCTKKELISMLLENQRIVEALSKDRRPYIIGNINPEGGPVPAPFVPSVKTEKIIPRGCSRQIRTDCTYPNCTCQI